MPAAVITPSSLSAPVRITVAEASALTGLSADILRRKIQHGEWEAHRPTPRTTMIKLSDVRSVCSPEVQELLPESLTNAKLKDVLARALMRPATANLV